MKKRIDRLQNQHRPSNIRVALGGFLVLCGLVFLTMGGNFTCKGIKEPDHVSKLVTALKQTQLADQALEMKNYGQARLHVRRLQSLLTSTLAEAQGVDSP